MLLMDTPGDTSLCISFISSIIKAYTRNIRGISVKYLSLDRVIKNNDHVF